MSQQTVVGNRRETGRDKAHKKRISKSSNPKSSSSTSSQKNNIKDKKYRIETTVNDLTKSNLNNHNIETNANDSTDSIIKSSKTEHSRTHLGRDLPRHDRSTSMLSEFRGVKQKGRPRSKKEEKKWRKKMKEIGRRHPEFELTYDLLLGIRTSTSLMSQSVVRSSLNPMDDDDSSEDDEDLDKEFSDSKRYSFPASGSSQTPPHSMNDFEFKDYCRPIFAQLREWFGVKPQEYLVKLCGGFNLLEFISNSKSGQFFFYSHDGQFLIKSMTRSESSFLRKILPQYYHYVQQQPNTLLTKFYGMYRVKTHNRQPIYFVVMGSVFYTDLEIHRIYDLKGSTHGRSATPAEKQQETPVLKDLDFLDDRQVLRIGKDKCKLFKEQLRRDLEVLRKLKIMDYSLLIGVHYRDRGVRRATIISEGSKNEFDNDKYQLDPTNHINSPSSENNNINLKSPQSPPPPQSQSPSVSKSKSKSGKSNFEYINNDNEINSNININNSNPNTNPNSNRSSHHSNNSNRSSHNSHHSHHSYHSNNSNTKQRNSTDMNKRNSIKTSPLPPLPDKSTKPKTIPKNAPSHLKKQSQSMPNNNHTKNGSKVLKLAPAKPLTEEMSKTLLGIQPTQSSTPGTPKSMSTDQELSWDDDTDEKEKGDGLGPINHVNNNGTTTLQLRPGINSLGPPTLKRIGSRRLSQIGSTSTRYVVKTPLENNFDMPELLDSRALIRQESKMDDDAVHDGGGSIFCDEHGGMCYADEDGNPANEIYFTGIIDILQKYNKRKKVENFFRGLNTDASTISAVPPEDYSRRMIDFLKDKIM